MPQAMEIPDAKAAVDEEWEKVKSRKEVILEAQRDKKESPLCCTDGRMSPQKMRIWSQNYSSTTAESCSEETLQKTTLEPLQLFAEQGSFASQIIVAKLTDVIARLQVVTDKQLMQYRPVLRLNWRMLQDGSKFPNRIVQMFGYVFHGTNGSNLGQKWKIPWYLLNEILYGHRLAGVLWKRQFEEASNELGWEKVPN